jgi:RNA polymerase sigma factor (sigma-70 family)
MGNLFFQVRGCNEFCILSKCIFFDLILIFIQIYVRYTYRYIVIYYRVVIIMILSQDEFSLLKKRNKAMLSRLYNYYAEEVKSFFYIRTYGNHAISDDLTQETFCTIIDYAPRLKSPTHLTSTVFFIARNKLADHQRLIYKEKKTARYMTEQIEQSGNIIADIHNRQKTLLFNMAVDSLPPFYRQVYEMYYVEDKEIKEIANHLQKTYKAIDNILFRIRRMLKKKMQFCAKNFFEDT